ncbi:hypothetical protein Hanom_Chr11g01041581 [Helianthus anomalus]
MSTPACMGLQCKGMTASQSKKSKQMTMLRELPNRRKELTVEHEKASKLVTTKERQESSSQDLQDSSAPKANRNSDVAAKCCDTMSEDQALSRWFLTTL